MDILLDNISHILATDAAAERESGKGRPMIGRAHLTVCLAVLTLAFDCALSLDFWK